MIVHERLPLARTEPSGRSGQGPRLRIAATPHVLLLHRELGSCASERSWQLELLVELPPIDPERLLAECEGYLVDGRDGRQIGVVDRVERSEATGEASTLVVVGGWLGRRRLRIEAAAVEALVPGEQRVIVDDSRSTTAQIDNRA